MTVDLVVIKVLQLSQLCVSQLSIVITNTWHHFLIKTEKSILAPSSRFQSVLPWPYCLGREHTTVPDNQTSQSEAEQVPTIPLEHMPPMTRVLTTRP